MGVTSHTFITALSSHWDENIILYQSSALLMVRTVREQDDYELIRKLGRGKYSEVFEGVNANNADK